MVFAVNPVIEEAKLLDPVPSLVVLSEVVGFELVLQHTPFAVILAPPSSMDSPPLDADEQVIDEIAVVVIVGAEAEPQGPLSVQRNASVGAIL